MKDHRITVDLDTGEFGAIYDDALRPYFDDLSDNHGTLRASDVEPDGDGWSAGIRAWVPGGEQIIGPFPTRAEALAAEIAYLMEVL